MSCIYKYKGQEFKTKEDLANFMKVNNQMPTKLNLDRDVAFKTVSAFTTVQEEEIQSTLAAAIFKHANKEISNFSSIDFEAYISEFVRQNLSKHKNDAYKERYLELQKHIPYFVKKVKDFYKAKGVEIIEEQLETEDGLLFMENTLLVDPKQNASAKIRALISLIPKYTKNENNNTVEDRDTFLGEPKFVSESAMWNTLKSGLADISKPSLKKLIDRLKEMAVFDPSMTKVVEALNAKKENPRTGELELDENLRTQFFNVYALNRIDYMSVLLTGEAGKGMGVKISTSDPSSQQSMIVRGWSENYSFLNSSIKQIGDKDFYFYKVGALENTLNAYENLREKVENEAKAVKKIGVKNSKSVRGKKSNAITEDLKQELLSVLELMGIDMDISGLNNLLRSKEFSSESSSLSISRLNGIFGRAGLKFLIEDIKKIHKKATTKDEKGKLVGVPILNEEGQNPLDDNKIIRLLATKQGEMMEDLAESNTLGAEGNLYSNYTTHTLVSSLINDWNNDINTIGEVTSSVHGLGSRVAAWMKSDPKNNKLKAFVLNNFKSLGKGDQGDKVSKLSDPEALGASVNITLSDGKIATYLGLAEADKSRQYVLKGGNFISSGLNYDSRGATVRDRYSLSNDNAADVLIGYFADEVFRMQAIYKNLNGDSAIPENERVSYLHDPKNAYTSYLFPEFNKPDKLGVTPLERFGIVSAVRNEEGDITGYMPTERLAVEDMLDNKALKEAVQKSFLNAVAGDVASLLDNKIIERDTVVIRGTNEKMYSFKNIGIDKNVVNRRYKGNVIEAIADYTLNSIIGSVETTKLFTGDPASFKSSEADLFKDFRKRIPLIIAGGIKSRVYKSKGEHVVRETYTSAVVNNIEAPSNYFFPNKDEEGNPLPDSELLENMAEAFNEGKEEGDKVTADDMYDLISKYENVNATDAQAWITLDTFKERLHSWGKWTDEHEDAYERITAKNPKLLPSDVRLFMQPLKSVHVEEMNRHGHRYLHYNKQSEAVIIPGLFPGLDAMQASSPDVDHFITLDGKKTGATGVAPINDGFDMLPQEDINLTPVKLKYDRLYLQQDLPTKQVKNALVGSQVVKNLLGEIVLNGEYVIPKAEGYEDRKVTGQELINDYHETVGLLSDIGSEEVQQEFGYNEETGRIDQKKFNDFLIKSMEDELTVSDIQHLEAGLTIDSLPSLRKKLESKLMATVEKKTVKLKQLGGAMIQMSSFGTLADTISISSKVKNGIVWLKDDVTEGLKPMQLKKDKDTGKLYTEKAQILLPHKFIIDLIGPRYKNMTSEEIKKILSPDVLMGISYRIPNQATASNDLFEIVGILPSEAGDTIISYNEITTKTGSDFDIDKAFIIVPNVEMDKKTGKLRRPLYAYQMSDEQAYEEKFNKDWSKSIRARELTKEIEKNLESKKEAIIDKIKQIQGVESTVQALRDIAPNVEENIEQEATTGDIAELISRYFDAALDEERESREDLRVDPVTAKRNRDKMLSLKNNLKKINNSVKAKVKLKLLEEKTMPSLEEFKKLPEVRKHTKAALQNLRIDLMQALLGDPKTYPSAVASLDNDFLEREAKELYEPTTPERNLKFFTGSNQSATKALFDKAKNLVGVIANQMSDHKLSQSFELVYNGLNFQIGKSKDNETLVSAITDTDGVYTSTWLNLYMNAIVDAAKDPFIVNANINQFTAPVAFMLIRSGVPVEYVNALIGQPILKELVKLKSVREGRFSQKVYDKKTGKRLTPEQELVNKYKDLAGITDKEVNAITLRNLNSITANTLKKQINDSKTGKTDPLKQLIILSAFNTFKETSKDLTDAVRAAKADVSNGKDLMQAELKEAKLLAVIKKGTIKNLEKKFGATVSEEAPEGVVHKDGFIDLDGSSMSGTFHRNGIQLPSKMFSGQTIMSTNAIKNLLFSTVFDLNPDLINREKGIDVLMNEIYSFIMGMEGAGVTTGDIKGMFYGDNSTPRKLERFKRANPELAASNILLRDTQISYRMADGEADFILFNNKSLDRELYQRAWSELFETHPEIASELVNYSYSSSGFNRNLFSFFQFIPTEELVNRGVGDFMSNLKKVFSQTTVLQNAKEQIIRHLADDGRIIKTVGPKDVKALNKDIDPKASFILTNVDDYLIGKDAFGQKETARWLRDPNSNLYKLLGNSKEGPVYMAVSKRGYYLKGKAIKEYYTPNNTLTSDLEKEKDGARTVLIVNGTYSKNTAPDNPGKGYVFTENLQARSAVLKQIGYEVQDIEGIPKVTPKLNVKTKNNQAGIRTAENGKLNENALGIVTKKYQQDANTKFVYEEGNFKDTDADFELFKKANEEVFEEMKAFSTLVFPKEFASSKAKLPKRFAEWLSQEMFNEFGLETSLKITKTSSGSTASIVSNGVKAEENLDSRGTIVEKNKQLLLKKATKATVGDDAGIFSITTPDVFVPLSNFRGPVAAWIAGNPVLPSESVVDSLQDSVLARAAKETGITDQDVKEAKKNCKI